MQENDVVKMRIPLFEKTPIQNLKDVTIVFGHARQKCPHCGKRMKVEVKLSPAIIVKKAI
jgi:hypothetical protein